MLKKEQIQNYIKAHNIKLSDEQQKKLDSMMELTDEEIDAVSGGCGTIPDNPTCPKCGSKNTFSENFPVMRGECRDCGERWKIYWN